MRADTQTADIVMAQAEIDLSPGLASIGAFEDPFRRVVIVIGVIGGPHVDYARISQADDQGVRKAKIKNLPPGGPAIVTGENAARITLARAMIVMLARCDVKGA